MNVLAFFSIHSLTAVGLVIAFLGLFYWFSGRNIRQARMMASHERHQTIVDLRAILWHNILSTKEVAHKVTLVSTPAAWFDELEKAINLFNIDVHKELGVKSLGTILGHVVRRQREEYDKFRDDLQKNPSIASQASGQLSIMWGDFIRLNKRWLAANGLDFHQATELPPERIESPVPDSAA